MDRYIMTELDGFICFFEKMIIGPYTKFYVYIYNKETGRFYTGFEPEWEITDERVLKSVSALHISFARKVFEDIKRRKPALAS